MKKYFYYFVFSLIELILLPFSKKQHYVNGYQCVGSFGIDEIFKQKHYCKKCYIIGRGPSLDKIDNLNIDDGVKICINDTYKHVNAPDFVFWHDAIFSSLLPDMKRANITIILPTILNLHKKKLLTTDYVSDCIYAGNVFLYEKLNLPPFFNIKNIYSNFMNIPNSLIGLSSTAHSAIWFAKKIGCETIIFIGMDGKSVDGRTYSMKYKQSKVRRITKFIHAKSRFENIFLCELLGLNYNFI